MKHVDINLLLNVLQILGSAIILIGIKMKWWKTSDFKIAKQIALDGFLAGTAHDEIASMIADKTKLTAAQAIVEVREIKKDIDGDKKPLSKRVQRAGRKLLWRFFDGGL